MITSSELVINKGYKQDVAFCTLFDDDDRNSLIAAYIATSLFKVSSRKYYYYVIDKNQAVVGTRRRLQSTAFHPSQPQP